ncbi:FAD binding domain-containing protein [Candidatus Palauibacter sp.]|uniref:FAD binding domain-containing protein n=1 Tax=Candidatus Palauibacter sp. TaxID=3101350 RepID=UPI003B0240E5
MLRLHPYEYHMPRALDEALSLLAAHGDDAMPIAGGTDLVPNMKHGLFTPGHLVALSRVREMRGIASTGDEIRIGAAETLTSVATHPEVLAQVPGLARAAELVSGPQLRRVGTIGGNVCLDTRCAYYNQTKFWRKALGYCLKKDGDVCHVVKGGTRCVAAHSADTPPVLAVLDAVLEVADGADGDRTRDVPIRQFFTSDGIWNRSIGSSELVVAIRIPQPPPGTQVAFQKLRSRQAIDFPLANLAVRVGRGDDGRVSDFRLVVSAMGAYPRHVGKVEEAALGNRLRPGVIEAVAEQAFRQCHPLSNITVDPEWRRAMIPVLVRRALNEIAAA